MKYVYKLEPNISSITMDINGLNTLLKENLSKIISKKIQKYGILHFYVLAMNEWGQT